VRCAAGAKECAAGQFPSHNGLSCLEVAPCPGGTHYVASAPDECPPCPAGKFTSHDHSQCVSRCLPGSIYRTESKACVQCARGQFAAGGGAAGAGAGECTKCAWGQFQSHVGQASCDKCQPTFFVDDEGQSECKRCAEGTTTAQAGLYVCTPIGALTTAAPAPAPAPAPQPGKVGCVAGRFLVVANVDSAEHCLLCPAGKYQPADSPHQSTCAACADGEVAGAAGRARCDRCAEGELSNSGRTKCVVHCPAGDLRLEDNKGCRACAAGRYSPTSDANSCLACAAGHFTEIWRTECVTQCAAGSYAAGAACQLCPVGKFARKAGAGGCTLCSAGRVTYAEGETMCSEPCAPGFFRLLDIRFTAAGVATASAGPATCRQCPAGKYQSAAISTSCNACVAGHFQPQPGMPGCVPCPAETSSAPGAVAASACGRRCPPGHYHFPVLAGCLGCAPGQSQPLSGADQCVLCQAGRFAEGWGSASCDACPTGSVRSTADRSACSAQCKPGSRPSQIEDSCVQCSKGKFSLAPQVACARCAAGLLSRPDRSSCEKLARCAGGAYSDGAGCSNCRRGSYHTSAMLKEGACLHCPAGKYQDLVGQQACKACPRGKHSTVASPGCVPCPAGRFAPSVGKCVLCAAGHFQEQESALACQKCSIERPVSLPTRERCSAILLCTAGTFAGGGSTSGAAGCTYCPAGKFQPAEGGTVVCTACPPGKFQAATGSSACSVCLPGHFASADRSGCAAPTPPPTPQPTAASAAPTPAPRVPTPAPEHFFIRGHFGLRGERESDGWTGNTAIKRGEVQVALHYAIREPAVQARVVGVASYEFSRGIVVTFELNCRTKPLQDAVNRRLKEQAFTQILAGQLNAGGFTVHADELHLEHELWKPPPESEAPAAQQSAGRTPTNHGKVKQNPVVVVACVMAGIACAVAGFLYFLKRDKGVRKRTSNFGKFNVLPDGHHEVKPFYHRAQDNVMSGSESEDDELGRTHRRDNEISESESGSEDDDRSRRHRLAEGLEAYKTKPKAGKRGARQASAAEAERPNSYHNEGAGAEDDNAI